MQKWLHPAAPPHWIYLFSAASFLPDRRPPLNVQVDSRDKDENEKLVAENDHECALDALAENDAIDFVCDGERRAWRPSRSRPGGGSVFGQWWPRFLLPPPEPRSRRRNLQLPPPARTPMRCRCRCGAVADAVADAVAVPMCSECLVRTVVSSYRQNGPH